MTVLNVKFIFGALHVTFHFDFSIFNLNHFAHLNPTPVPANDGGDTR
jgi:hypothetical protein